MRLRVELIWVLMRVLCGLMISDSLGVNSVLIGRRRKISLRKIVLDWAKGALRGRAHSAPYR